MGGWWARRAGEPHGGLESPTASPAEGQSFLLSTPNTRSGCAMFCCSGPISRTPSAAPGPRWPGPLGPACGTSSASPRCAAAAPGVQPAAVPLLATTSSAALPTAPHASASPLKVLPGSATRFYTARLQRSAKGQAHGSVCPVCVHEARARAAHTAVSSSVLRAPSPAPAALEQVPANLGKARARAAAVPRPASH